ncbi:ribosome recycling factor [Candidatus Nucleicultrix amoebiphila]|jgi:ribosome recycling factor|uniref:Ribosome-recycling factor n=1 Tax=Candidatus Nucleicultrix amoebiphila FS5 TaxID=1414854 RepID=A0A1W6N5P3_9PROT|nr:ribosome-recycling factor [Candidatus Nucleicultrix amoebiphila FS5]
MSDFDVKEYERRMNAAIDVLHKEFAGLRTGRASINFLEPVVIDAYGGKLPLSQLATVNAPEARMLAVQVWDAQMAPIVEKAIRDAGLGVNPMREGQVIRVPMPELSKERRQELSKVAAKYAEQGRISVRNVRRDALDYLKKMEKDGTISEDQFHKFSDQVQKFTDQSVKKIDDTLALKEKDIMQV